MTFRVPFRWLLALAALLVPAALCPGRAAEPDEPSTAPQASSDVVFRHYL